MIKFLNTAALLFYLSSSSFLAAQDYDAGVRAMKAGDFALAFENWHPLADQGDIDAQRNLGVMYANDQGVSQSDGEAALLFGKAAEQGDAVSQRYLGLMYRDGKGVVQDWSCHACVPVSQLI